MKHLKLGLVQTGDPLKLCTDQYNAFCDAMKDVLGVELIQSEWEINGAEDAERIATAFEARAVDRSHVLFSGGGWPCNPALYTLPSGGCGLVPARTDAGRPLTAQLHDLCQSVYQQRYTDEPGNWRQTC